MGVLYNFENDEALPGLDGRGKFAVLEREGRIFKDLGQSSELELTQVAAFCCRGAVAEGAR